MKQKRLTSISQLDQKCQTNLNASKRVKTHRNASKCVKTCQNVSNHYHKYLGLCFLLELIEMRQKRVKTHPNASKREKNMSKCVKTIVLNFASICV